MVQLIIYFWMPTQRERTLASFELFAAQYCNKYIIEVTDMIIITVPVIIIKTNFQTLTPVNYGFYMAIPV